ncbi:MAG: hypothetical protein OEZ45_14735, partial [Candidatus Aminicenantes bacterium]|nr:hypothetical protein [Candidatus Aminicenantes bacterium]
DWLPLLISSTIYGRHHKFRDREELRLGGEKTVWKAERAWFLDRRERRAKPGIEPLLTRWGKRGVFLNHPT